MKHQIVKIDSDKAYILPIGDLHIGDKAFSNASRSKLSGYLKWVKETPNARIILNGDLLNCATRSSKTSPFEQDMTLEEQITAVCEFLDPVKDRIIGAVCGNHEMRIADFSGYDPTLAILWKLGLDTDKIYFKYCGVLDIKVGKRIDRGKETNRVQYTVVFHHTTGGGKLIGSKLNRVDQMRESTITNGDVYLGSHNHSLSAAPVLNIEYDPTHKAFIERKQTLVSCGSYLEWNDSYAEAKQLAPMKLGSPRIRLDGSKKDVHVNL